MPDTSPYRDQVLTDGFLVVPGIIANRQIADLIEELNLLGQNDSIRRRGGIFAVRNLLVALPTIRALAESDWARELVAPILGEDAFPVRGILFDKTPDANWKVPWHQDVTIAIAERREVEGFGPWSIKAGVLHVQPPAPILENMLTVRIHLDSCGAENGALRVIAGSHLAGRLHESEAYSIGANKSSVVCAAEAGDALLMRPLLLHASSASAIPAHRRVIHIDYANRRLPGGLRWLA